MQYDFTEAEKKLCFSIFKEIPSIGKAGSQDLWFMGFRNVQDLKNKNPMQLYHRLNEMTGMVHDICMLYTFRCAVYYVTEKVHDAEKLNWWYWKDKRYLED